MLVNLFRMCLNEDLEYITGLEEAAVERLVAAKWPLALDGNHINTKTEEGSNACAAYLAALDNAAATLHLEKAPRTYRDFFTLNYRALFPDEARLYRVDVLEAAFEQYAVIWVNGDKFEFSTEVMHRAEALQKAWWEVCGMLDRWNKAPTPGIQRPLRSEIRDVLVGLDFAWSNFEHKYIYELIAIEEKARRLLVQAIEQERQVHMLEIEHSDPMALLTLAPYCEGQRLLVANIAHLNSVANISRKGRDDLKVEVLFDAVNTLRKCESAESVSKDAENLRAARILATDVMVSFEAMRIYLREVEHCLERVDPHLCNNAGLVARLVDWEESWEMGTRYMQNEGLLLAVCGLVAEIRETQEVVPELRNMIEECDVELFLVLPRIMWLCFLANPKRYQELLRGFLPHRFSDAKTGSEGAQDLLHDAQLSGFVREYISVEGVLLGALPQGANSAAAPDATRKAVWEVLVQEVALGKTAKDSLFVHLAPARREEAQAAIRNLTRSLEPWSIEVQRHCPEDWNQCCAVLVQCLTRGPREQKDVSFHV